MRKCPFCGCEMESPDKRQLIHDETGKWIVEYQRYLCPECKVRFWL